MRARREGTEVGSPAGKSFDNELDEYHEWSRGEGRD